MLFEFNKNEFVEIVENEFVDDVEIVENSIEKNIVIRSTLTIGLIIEIMQQYNIPIDYDDVVEFIKLNINDYLIIVKFENVNEFVENIINDVDVVV